MLKRLFVATGPAPIEALVRAKPTGSYARRIWFLYEWLTGKKLKLPDLEARSPMSTPSIPSSNGRARPRTPRATASANNLPGTPEFCPLVFRTPALEEFIALGLADRAKAMAADVPADLLARTAAFLLLKDFTRELRHRGRRPAARPRAALGPRHRPGRTQADRPRRAPAPAADRHRRRPLRRSRIAPGRAALSASMTATPARPCPNHISARPDDLPSLIDGMIAFDRQRRAGA